jgi:hypothetical protein
VLLLAIAGQLGVRDRPSAVTTSPASWLRSRQISPSRHGHDQLLAVPRIPVQILD